MACVLALALGSVGCAMLGRAGTVDNNKVTAQATADVDARVDARVDATLAAFTSEIQSAIETKIEAAVETQLGDRVGRDQHSTTTDSVTSVVMACGLTAMPVLILAVYYRNRMQKSFAAAKRVITTVERARQRQPCDCGRCADCIVRTLKGRGDPTGRTLHRMVKAVT